MFLVKKPHYIPVLESLAYMKGDIEDAVWKMSIEAGEY